MKFLLLIALLTSCSSFLGKGAYEQKESIQYADGFEQRHGAEAFIPQGTGPFPGVIMVHGGGWKSRSYEDIRVVAKSLATRGFSVLSINYRFSPEHRHPAPVEDLEKALQHFKTNAETYKLDPKRIGLWGYSSGAHTVAYYAMTRNLNPELKVQAVVAGGGPYDFTKYPRSPLIKDYMGKYRDEALEAYREASPTLIAKPGLPPFFLYHGKQDRLVTLDQMSGLVASLKAQNVRVKHYEVVFWGHANTFIFSTEAVKRGVKFLIQELQHN